VEPEELAAAILELSAWAERNAPQPEPALRVRVREHLGVDPGSLEVVNEDLSAYDHVNVQVALDALAGTTGETPEIVGLSMEHGWRVGLTELAQGGGMGGMVAPGPVEYDQVDVGDRVISCLRSALLLVAEGDDRLIVLVSPPPDPHEGGLQLQAMAPARATAEAWLARLRRLMQEHNVYRGKVVAFGGDHPFRPAPLTVRTLPHIDRSRIVLPEVALERIERHTAGLAKHRDRLRATGRHVKRGLLLHGPPGTGKTMTVMYLAGLMPERTVVLLTGESLGAVTPAAALARSLEPAMVVLEDVDLIARHRAHFHTTPLLFELLNAMDGLDEDADLIFVLTTNRAKDLEPALASRPGRIDLAVELPLPDAHARRRLLALYGEGLPLEVADWEPVVAATEGTSPAFIRELFRRAALIAAEEDDAGAAVTPAIILNAVAELKDRSGRLTATLLGAVQPDEPDDADAETWDDA
jgi:ATPase family associated with various cellular activities (AAA)